MQYEIINGLSDAVINGDTKSAEFFARKAVEMGLDAYDCINEGCAKGMAVVSDKYEKGEYFPPEVICSAEAMKEAIHILQPHLKVDKASIPKKVVIGVVRGDIHEIGKDIVKIILEAGGCSLIDLGRDVPNENFINVALGVNADVVALSAMMTTTMTSMPDIIKELKTKEPSIAIVVGGSPLSEETAMEYGADGYGKDAASALRIINNLIAVKKLEPFAKITHDNDLHNFRGITPPEAGRPQIH